MKETTIGIALSGGGARAAAHIGVLQALNENGIFPTHISGASGGSVIGALYCSGYAPLEILDLTKTASFLHIFKLGLGFKSIRDMSRLKEFLYYHIKHDFNELPIPLFLSATNLDSGLNEIMCGGKLIPAIMASCAIPLVFKPVVFNGNTYVDGGVLNNLPVDVLREKSAFVLGSNVSGLEKGKKINSRLEIAHRCLQLAISTNVAPRLKMCDHAIEIEDAFHFGVFDIQKTQELFDIGYTATVNEMEAIKLKLAAKC
ncbi:Patatin [Cellulophaga algicola DSM 14237]|uniref:Patatin n=1 Tax=Cellulophaga algicola (strain DSM 14237 / IC166 / ACAM 630) TaxID=688270 RepID=E6X8U0_CELAD|nr:MULTISPECIES: patatin-like phospholipase family protein [Cellulophaga]ADV48685.1 Patatin [Cellulophaga algicola DSM 14237]